jgi:beta-galactosidase/beta-glucuronidase
MSKRTEKIAILLLVLTALSLATRGIGEPLKVSNPGTGSIPLQGNWQFHLGDDKGWADPALDDSGWEQIHVDAPWGAQSHPSYTGFAWYRHANAARLSMATQIAGA